MTTVLRDVSTMITGGAGSVANAFRLTALNAYDGSSALPDWVALTGLYESYRVNSISVQYVPAAPNDVSTTQAFTPLYIVLDPDDITGLTSAANALAHANCKVKNLYRPWTYKIKVPRYTGTSSASIMMGGGWMDAQNPVSTGAIKMYASGLDISSEYGYFIFSYNVSFKGRQ